MSSMDECTIVSTNTKKQKNNGPKSCLVGHHGPSPVWDHFDKHFIEGTQKYSGKAECKYCHVVVDAPSGGGTNKLWNHLKVRKCKKFPGFVEEKNTQSVLSFSDGQASIWFFDQEKCRASLARMTVLDELPFSHVEKEGFRQFCHDMQPKFHVISRTTLTKDCIKLFYVEKCKLKDYLKEFSKRVSITTDMWTSVQNLGYIVITAHFVDKDWILRKKMISFKVELNLEFNDPSYKNECTVKGELLDEGDWGILKALHTFLEEFYLLTKRVSGSKYYTSNMYFDELIQVKDLILHNLGSDDLFIREMAEKMNEKLNKYCKIDALNMILVVSLVLDLRYKLQYVEYWYSSFLEKTTDLDEKVRSEQVQGFVKKLKDLMKKLFNHYKVENLSMYNVDDPQNEANMSNSVGMAVKRPSSKELFKCTLKRKSHGDMSSDLDIYLSDEDVSWD